MKKVLCIVLSLLVLAAGMVVWLVWSSEEARIRRVFAAVEKDVAKDGEMALFTQAMHIKSVSDRVAQRCRFRLEAGPEVTLTRKEFAECYAYYVRDMKSIRVAFKDLEIGVAGQQADVSGTMDFTGSDAMPYLGGPLVRRFSVQMERGDDGDWRFLDVLVPEN